MHRLATVIICAGLSVGLFLGAVAHAQDVTLPERVGQIADVQGQVSFFGTNTGGWTAAMLNYPVVSGDTVYTEPGSQAAITIDWSRMTLNGGTELQVTRVAPHYVQAALPQGEAFFDIRGLTQGDQYQVTTPRGTVTIAQDGQYDIIAGDADYPTEITTLNGVATVQGPGLSTTVFAHQTAYLQGENPITVSLFGIQSNPFIDRMMSTEYAPPPPYVPPAVAQMTGAYQLSDYGTWSEAPDYGVIWYPNVGPDWAPYHDGHWGYVEPWGWTWIDAEPWGFAPFHYGRWVQYGGRWGWVPVYGPAVSYYQPPVYAPALVSFFSVDSGLAISVGFGIGAFDSGAIGWVPLAPGELYLPWYHCPPHYVRRINAYNVRDIDRIVSINNTVVNRTVIDRYAPEHLRNRQAAMVAPARALRQGDPVARFARPLPNKYLTAAKAIPPTGVRGFPARAERRLPSGTGRREAVLTRLPAAPPGAAHRAPARAPRPAPFAASRGMPVARPVPSQQRPLPSIHTGGPNVHEQMTTPSRIIPGSEQLPAIQTAPQDHALRTTSPTHRPAPQSAPQRAPLPQALQPKPFPGQPNLPAASHPIAPQFPAPLAPRPTPQQPPRRAPQQAPLPQIFQAPHEPKPFPGQPNRPPAQQFGTPPAPRPAPQAAHRPAPQHAPRPKPAPKPERQPHKQPSDRQNPNQQHP